MPRSTREYLLRFADQALNALENALERLKRLQDAYGDQAPDHRTAVELIGLEITHAHEMLSKFRHEIM